MTLALFPSPEGAMVRSEAERTLLWAALLSRDPLNSWGVPKFPTRGRIVLL